MLVAIQAPCQSRKTAENGCAGQPMGDFANQDLAGFAMPNWEHSPPERR
jgi:hypothetical protein